MRFSSVYFKFPADQANGCPVVRVAIERAALGKSLHATWPRKINLAVLFSDQRRELVDPSIVFFN